MLCYKKKHAYFLRLYIKNESSIIHNYRGDKMTTSSGILQSYLITNVFNTIGYEELLEHNREKKGGDFLSPLSFYLGILDKIDPVMIPYMFQEGNEELKKRREQLTHELIITYVLLLTQKHYELTHQKTENSKTYDAQIKQCTELLDALNPSWQARITKCPEQAYLSPDKPVAWCGIPLAQEFAAKMVAFMDRKTKTITDALGAFNEKRLYWVWGSSFIKTMLSLLPNDFYNAQQATEVIKAPDPYTGTLSWSLYYFRFSLNLFLLLKHTIKGPWMSKEEGDTPWSERFQSQWAQRKFALLNDSLWGTANLVCFFWLNGKVLGPWADALTIVLLVFDISMALWDFAEQQTKHNAEMAQYDKDIAALTTARGKLLSDALKEAETEEERKLAAYKMQMQLQTLERAKKRCSRNWELQKLGLYNNIGYAIGLMFAFIVLTAPFMPITAATAVTLGIVGAVLCFAFTVISSAIKGGIEIYKSHHARKEATIEFQVQVDLLKEKLKANSSLNDNEKKLLYLEIKKLQAESEYQKQMIVLQSVQLVRSLMIDVLIPAVIFSCLVFLPMGIGFAALGAALGLAIASNLLVNALFAPDAKMKELPTEFPEKEYTDFCKLVVRESSFKEQHAFFKPKKAEEHTLQKNNDASYDAEPPLGLDVSL